MLRHKQFVNLSRFCELTIPTNLEIRRVIDWDCQFSLIDSRDSLDNSSGGEISLTHLASHILFLGKVLNISRWDAKVTCASMRERTVSASLLQTTRHQMHSSVYPSIKRMAEFARRQCGDKVTEGVTRGHFIAHNHGSWEGLR